MTIVVADDDDDFRALVAETLRSDGYSVMEARDGLELLTLVGGTSAPDAVRPNVVVTDVEMPGLTGLGLLERLQRARIKLPVVLMTGHFPASIRTLAKELGARLVLAKPFQADELRAAVSSALRPTADLS